MNLNQAHKELPHKVKFREEWYQLRIRKVKYNLFGKRFNWLVYYGQPENYDSACVWTPDTTLSGAVKQTLRWIFLEQKNGLDKDTPKVL